MMSDNEINSCFMVPQSGTEQGVRIGDCSRGANATSQNMSFFDQCDGYTYDVESTTDVTRTGQDTTDSDLGNFFSRPIRIYETAWETNTTLASSFDPWSLYFENPRVVNRICNFNILRCKLHVKIVINGNGFLYGRGMASYIPLFAYDTMSVYDPFTEQSLVQASQCPRIFLDPTLSKGGEMVLPFFYHKNNARVIYNEWADLGFLTLRSINTLKHANGGTNKATVSVFAWAEDVKLSLLTTVPPLALVPQSGKESEVNEANKTGMISGPATQVANLASALSVVPTIAPFALATEAAARGVAKAAKLLGYSRPAMTVTPIPMRPSNASSLCNTTLPDTVSKLSMDDKQEMTIDPRIAGIGPQDPLVITNISTRETYYCQFDWPVSASADTFLWNARVTPVVWREVNQTFFFPACTMAALPFRYWTGTINFRFQIVASAFHKGRLKIVYDPNYLASNEFNVNYNEIVDIADKTDFTISIANATALSLINHHRPGIEPETDLYSTTPFTGVDYGNGVIGVYIVNQLTTPNIAVNNDIKVNVYISTGDDFEVFVPDDHIAHFSFFNPNLERLASQSGMEVADSENTDEKDAPSQSMSTALGSNYDTFSNLNAVFTGETIKSFRPLLKRYNLHYSLWPMTGSASLPIQMYARLPMYPFLRGDQPGAIHLSASGQYNYCNTLLMHWVTYAFQGWRGAIRRKFIFKGWKSNGFASTFYAQRSTLEGYEYMSALATNFGNMTQAAYEIVHTATNPRGKYQAPQGSNGTVYLSTQMNDVLEIESPYYSPYRFTPGKNPNWTTPSLPPPIETVELTFNGVTGQHASIDVHVAAGDDFQVYFFTGLPPMIYEASPPVPF